MLQLMRSRGLRVALMLCAFGFIAWSGWTLCERWEHNTVSIAAWPAALALVAVLGSMLLMALAWSLLIGTLTPIRPPLSRMLAVYAESMLGKYVPGKVGQPVMRIAGVAPYGGSALTVVTSMVLEVLSWGATGGLVAAFLLWWSSATIDGGLGLYAVPIFVGSLVAVVGLVTIDQARYPAFARKLLGASTHGPLLPLGVPLVHVGSWVLWAAHAVLLARAVGLTDLAPALHSAAFFVLAPVAGFLALPMPAGAGVRESLMVLGLVPSVGAANALAAALLARAISLAVDVLMWLVLSRRWPGRVRSAA